MAEIPISKNQALQTIMDLAQGCLPPQVATLPRADVNILVATPLPELLMTRRALASRRTSTERKREDLYNKKKTLKTAFEKAAYALINIRDKVLDINGSSGTLGKQLEHIEAEIDDYDEVIEDRTNPLVQSNPLNPRITTHPEPAERVSPITGNPIQNEYGQDIPATCLCPILHTPMVDPVILEDGHSYEKAAIEEWLRMGRSYSPMTNLPLASTTLRPNISLRNTIAELHRETRIR